MSLLFQNDYGCLLVLGYDIGGGNHGEKLEKGSNQVEYGLREVLVTFWSSTSWVSGQPINCHGSPVNRRLARLFPSLGRTEPVDRHEEPVDWQPPGKGFQPNPESNQPTTLREPVN